MSEGIKVRGFFRVQIDDDGEIVGDSGWSKNAIPNDGFRFYLTEVFASSSNSLRVTHVTVGTGTQPGAANTNLEGELTHVSNFRQAVARASNGSTRVDYTATFGSALLTAAANISNIGLFATSTTNGGTIFAGNTYASSTWATNQNVNVTYSITFA